MRAHRCVISLATLWASACVTLPQPTPADVLVANQKWPEANLETLQAGRKALVARCSGCHTVPLPSEFSPTEWLPILADMHEEAHVTEADRVLIDQFVLTLSESYRRNGANK